MLIDTLVDDRDRDALLPVLGRRARYLAERARSLAERRLGGDEWQTTMARASLHLETAEAMATLDHVDEARFSVQLALADYLALQMPFGAALQRAFLTDHGSFAARTDAFVARWAEDGTPKADADERDDQALAFRSRAAETPQQWAYLAIAIALGHAEHEASLRPALQAFLERWRAVPFGRLRFPLEDVLTVIGANEATPESAVTDILVEQLVATYRAVRFARANRYLWMRGLAPVPWFDLDLALLIAVANARAGSPRIREAVVQAVPAEARDYAIEYLTTVDALQRGRPRSATPSFRDI